MPRAIVPEHYWHCRHCDLTFMWRLDLLGHMMAVHPERYSDRDDD